MHRRPPVQLVNEVSAVKVSGRINPNLLKAVVGGGLTDFKFEPVQCANYLHSFYLRARALTRRLFDILS